MVNFIANYAKVGLEPRIRKLRSVLLLKAGPVGKSIVYTSYKSSALTSLVSELLHK